MIGDDWFTKNMLVNTLYRTENLRSQLTNTTEVRDLFSQVLNQIMTQNNVQLPSQLRTHNFDPNLYNAINPHAGIPTTPISSNESFRFQAIDPEKINQVLGGKLKGMGNVIVRAGQQYNIDPALLTAIAQHETGNGKSRAAIEKNNIAGMMGKNGLKSYAFIEDSIMEMARNLSKNYLGAGLSSLAQIGAKYAPVGASNDPTNLNNHWVTGVSEFVNQLRV